LFDEVIEEALDAAKCVVVLWSTASVASSWVRAEAAEAMHRKILVPVLIEHVKIPLEFRRLQAADLSQWPDAASDPQFAKFSQSIDLLVSRGERPIDLGDATPEPAVTAPEERFPLAGMFQQTLRTGVTPSVSADSRAVPATHVSSVPARAAEGMITETWPAADVPVKPPQAKGTRLTAPHDAAIAASVPGRLNWKHYAGAVVMFATLAAVGSATLARLFSPAIEIQPNTSSAPTPTQPPEMPPPESNPQTAPDSLESGQPGRAANEKPPVPIESPRNATPRPARLPPRPPVGAEPAPPTTPEEPARPASPAPQAPLPSSGAGLETETAPPAGSPDLSFQKVKMVVQSGDDAHEINVVLSFYADRLVIAAEEGGATIKAFPYQSIATATYARSRTPLWKTGAAPVRAVGSFVSMFSRPSPWLTVQSTHDLAVLHLDRDKSQPIISAFEKHSGKKIEMINDDR
jgi:hypothetical protein